VIFLNRSIIGHLYVLGVDIVVSLVSLVSLVLMDPRVRFHPLMGCNTPIW